MSTHNRPLRKIQSTKLASDNREVRKVPVPSHRLTPLKEHWLKIYTPVVDHLRLDIRFNVKSRNVEIRNPVPDDEIGSQHLQKAADFVKAFVYGFEVEDALALIRLDNLFVESFEVCTSCTYNTNTLYTTIILVIVQFTIRMLILLLKIVNNQLQVF